MFNACTCVLHVVAFALLKAVNDVKEKEEKEKEEEVAVEVEEEEEDVSKRSIPTTSFVRSSDEFPARRRRTTIARRRSTGALFLGSDRRMATKANENPALLRRMN